MSLASHGTADEVEYEYFARLFRILIKRRHMVTGLASALLLGTGLEALMPELMRCDRDVELTNKPDCPDHAKPAGTTTSGI